MSMSNNNGVIIIMCNKCHINGVIIMKIIIIIMCNK